LPEWTAQDHDHNNKPTSGQVDTEKRKAAMPDLTKNGINDVVLAAWKQNCIQCHGVIGRGDGPQGRSLRPPDFTNAGWQRTALDSEMEHTIKKGRGNMPAFGHLPDDTVRGLVNLIRMLNPNRAKEVMKNGEGAAEGEKPDTPGTPAP
jgi:mono/diheme cytochrome c family protein